MDGRAPYNSLLTHGFTVDGEGRKMSKSLQNATAPRAVSDRLGAEILRLWVTSTDYSTPPEVQQTQYLATDSSANSQSGEAYFGQAADAFRSGQYRDAMRLANHAAVESPQNPKAPELMSLALFASDILSLVPWTLDTSSWYFPQSALALLFLVGLAAFAAYAMSAESADRAEPLQEAAE